MKSSSLVEPSKDISAEAGSKIQVQRTVTGAKRERRHETETILASQRAVQGRIIYLLSVDCTSQNGFK